jgi:hypothetical protein
MDPIFVCGAPRSGVRLLGALLDSHPHLACGPELPFIVTMAQQWRDLDSTLGLNHEQHYDHSRAATREAFRAAILKLVAPHLERTRKPRFIFQSFAAAMSLEVLATLFPHARFVLLVRDARASAASLLRCQWRNPRDGQRLAYTQDVQAGARFWVEFNALMARAAPALSERALWLRYEDLSADPIATCDRLARFLDVASFQPMIDAHSARHVIATQSDPHPELRSGQIDRSSIDHWRAVLDTRQRAAIQAIAASGLAKFGYA